MLKIANSSEKIIKGYQEILENPYWDLPPCVDYDPSKDSDIIVRYLRDSYAYESEASKSRATYAKMNKEPNFVMIISDYQKTLPEYTKSKQTFDFTSMILREYIKTLTNKQLTSIRQKANKEILNLTGVQKIKTQTQKMINNLLKQE